MDKCNRCGQCCIVYAKTANLNGENVDIYSHCDHLKAEHGGRCGGRTYCAIYPYRIGAEVAKGIHCINRMESKFDYPNCPYNSGKPVHPAFDMAKRFTCQKP